MYQPVNSTEMNRTSTPNKMCRRLMPSRSAKDSKLHTKSSKIPLNRIFISGVESLNFCYSMELVSQAIFTEGNPA